MYYFYFYHCYCFSSESAALSIVASTTQYNTIVCTHTTQHYLDELAKVLADNKFEIIQLILIFYNNKKMSLYSVLDGSVICPRIDL